MPAVTPLLAAAREKGCRTQTGVEMFDAQVDFITEFCGTLARYVCRD